MLLPLLLLRRSALALESQRLVEARADAARAIDLEQRGAEPGSHSHRIGRAYLALGRALAAQGEREEAQAAFASALAHLEPTLGADHPETRAARQLALDAGSPMAAAIVTAPVQ